MCEAVTIAAIAFVVTSVAGAGLSAYQAQQQAEFQNAQARAEATARQQAMEYQAAIDRNNAQIAEWQRADSIQRAEMDAQRVMLERADVQARQRALLAASGIDINEGSSLDILASTEFLSEWDINTIQSNAAREAWGYEVKKNDLLTSSNFNTQMASNIRPAKISSGRAAAMAGGASLLSSVGSYAAAGGFGSLATSSKPKAYMRTIGGPGW